MNNKCIIFPHIPKCGGTSLKKIFEKSDIKTYFDYEFPPHSTRKYFIEQCQRRNRESKLLDFGGFDIVFGHFPIVRYQRQNYQYITLLRHPLERAISHYFYWKNLLPISNLMAIYREPVIKEIKNGNISFLDFIDICNLSEFYLSYLSTFNPQDFLLVGFIDNYGSFLMKLSKYLKVDLSDDVYERQGIKEDISKKHIYQGEKMLKNEIERYENFRKYWD